jgi:TorA maturation chaperone TorD
MTIDTEKVPNSARAEAIASTMRILGALYLQDPKLAESQILLDELGRLPSLEGWPFGSELEVAQSAAMVSAGLATSRTELAREYQRLFIGPQAFKAPAWGSVYLDKDQVLFGSSTLELRQWMRTNGITINEDKREPEDHIGKMLILLGWLATEKPHLLPEFLGDHLMPWAPRYLELLFADARQPFYRGLAVLTRTTLEDIVAQCEAQVSRKKLFR